MGNNLTDPWESWGWLDNSVVEDWDCIGAKPFKGCYEPLPTDGQGFFSFINKNHVGNVDAMSGSVFCATCALEHLNISPGITPAEMLSMLEPVEDIVIIHPDENGQYPIENDKYHNCYWKWVTEWPAEFVCTAQSHMILHTCTKILTGLGVNSLQFCYISGTDGSILCESCANKNGYYLNPPAGEKKSIICLGCEIPNCNVCGICHTEDCSYDGYRVTTPTLAAKYSHLRAKTQKVRGYVVLGGTKLRIPRPYSIIINNDDIEPAIAVQKDKQSFVRPCPTRPRHGFVDSRPMKIGAGSGEELKALLAKAKSADEQGAAELLIVPYIKSEYNAIITPSRIAIGRGNDGATSGHGSVVFPLAGVPFPEISYEVLKKSGVDAATEDPYIEAVVNDDDEVFFTQLRAGVKIPASVGVDFIPNQIRVVDVIDASGDLLEWEAQTKVIAAGTVVCHIGGTLISHYGVHCMQNNIPVMTSRRPEIGEVLESVGRTEKPNPEDVIRGLAAGAEMGMIIEDNDPTPTCISVYQSLIAMMTTLHNSAAMSGSDGYWLGVATSIMLRAGMAASHGEARHKVSPKVSRNTIYKLAFKEFFSARATLGQAQWKFRNNSWSSGYGGKAWGDCTEAIIKMDTAIRKLINDPTTENVAQVVVELNNAVNQAHNGGWWLNKFITQNKFTSASQQTLDSVVSGAVALYNIAQITKAIPVERIDAVIAEWKALPEIEVKVGNVLAHQFKNKGKAKGSVGIESNDPALAAAKVKYLSDWVPCEDLEYEGTYCPGCGQKYTSFKYESDINQGTTPCGKFINDNNCPGIVGWMNKGNFEYTGATIEPADLDEDQDDHESEKPEDYDPDCNCASCVPYHTGGNIDEYDDVDDDDNNTPEPGVIMCKPTSNVGGLVYPDSDTEIISAQANVHESGELQILHIQFRTDKSNGYYSLNLKLGKQWIDTANYTYLDIPKLKSYSGSGVDNYMGFEFKLCSGHLWKLAQSDLKLNLVLDIYNLTCIGVPNEPSQEIETQAAVQIKPQPKPKSSSEINGSDDIPF